MSGGGSELGVEVDLQDVGAEGRPGDFIGAHPAQRAAHGFGEGHGAADGETFYIRSAAAEVGVGEGIDHRVGFDIAITEAGLPIAE